MSHLKLRKLTLFSDEIAGLFLAIYIASQIVFPLKINIYISNSINILLWSYFILYLLINKESILKINYYVVLYSLFTLFVFLSLLWSIDFELSKSMAKTVFLNAINIIILYNLIKKFNINNYILYGIIAGAFYNYLVALDIIQIYNPFYNQLQFIGTMARSGSMAIVMLLSMFATMMLWDQVRHRVFKVFLILNLFLAMYVIFLTVSKKGIIIGIFLIVLFMIQHVRNYKSILQLLLVGALFAVAVVKFSDAQFLQKKVDRTVDRFMELEGAIGENVEGGSTGDRLYFIQSGIEAFFANPLLGTGISTFSKHNDMGYYAHNNYIELIVGVGLIGMLLYYLIFIYSYVKLRSVHSSTQKRVLQIFLFALLVMDNAIVTYNLKVILFVLLYISIYIEEHSYKVGLGDKNA